MKKIVSSGGLKYALSDEMFDKIMEKDNDSRKLWNNIDSIIEVAEDFPAFWGFITFVANSFWCNNPWYCVPIIALVVYLITFILSFFPSSYDSNILNAIITLYIFVSQFFIDKILIIVLSLFVIHNIWAGIVYIIFNFLITFFILIPKFMRYEQRIKLNDKLATIVLENYLEIKNVSK